MRYLKYILLALWIISVLFEARAHAHAPGILSAYNVMCEDQNCPPGVGALVLATHLKDPSGQDLDEYCSGNLLPGNRVLTAYHCLPRHLRFAGADCAADVQFYLPGLPDREPETLTCDHVLKLTETPPLDDIPDRPEWVILQLKGSTTRPPVVFRSEPLGVNESVVSYPVSSSPMLFRLGTMTKVTCRGGNVGHDFPLTFGDRAPLFYGRDCDGDLRGGNSGAGLFDTAGRAVGWMTFIVDGDYSEYNGVESRAFVGTKAFCVPDLGAGRDTSGVCAWDPRDPGVQSVGTLFSVLQDLPPFPQPVAGPRVRWGEASREEALNMFSWAYPNVDLALALRVLADPAAASLRVELASRVQRLLPQVPRCVRDAGAVGSWSEVFPYPTIAFGDPDRYPENGVFLLSMAPDIVLRLRASVENVFVKITKTPDASYRVALDSLPAALQLSPADAQLARDCEAHADALPPPDECRRVFAVKNRQAYIQPFNFEVPACPNGLSAMD